MEEEIKGLNQYVESVPNKLIASGQYIIVRKVVQESKEETSENGMIIPANVKSANKQVKTVILSVGEDVSSHLIKVDRFAYIQSWMEAHEIEEGLYAVHNKMIVAVETNSTKKESTVN